VLLSVVVYNEAVLMSIVRKCWETLVSDTTTSITTSVQAHTQTATLVLYKFTATVALLLSIVSTSYYIVKLLILYKPSTIAAVLLLVCVSKQ
jgi:hypothetical protein